jgi:hypothetical protein
MRLSEISHKDAALLTSTEEMLNDATDPLAQQKATIANQQKQLTVKRKQIAAQQAQRKNNAAQAALSKARSKP